LLLADVAVVEGADARRVREHARAVRMRQQIQRWPVTAAEKWWSNRLSRRTYKWPYQ